MQNPSSKPATPKRKIPILWIAIGTLVATLGLFLFQLFGPNPPILVSKQTTFITEPLGEDGLPDYEAYLLQQGSAGVTPENNAAVLFWKAIWPGELGAGEQQMVCQALGMPSLPEDGLVDLRDSALLARVFADLHGESPEDADSKYGNAPTELVEQAIDDAGNHPWTSSQLPGLATWVSENQKSLDLLAQASSRPRYYSPSPTLLNGEDNWVWSVLLQDIQAMRGATIALRTRAMYHLGEGRLEEAWRNLRACHRLARHCSENRFLVSQLVATAIDEAALRSDIALLSQEDINLGLASKILGDLRSLSSSVDLIKSIDDGERICFIDTVVSLATGKLTYEDTESFGINGDMLMIADISRINWNRALREGNKWYDQAVQVAKQTERRRQQKMLDDLEAKLLQEASSLRNTSTKISSIFSPNQRNQMASAVVNNRLMPAMSTVFAAEDRAATQLELTKLAAALAVYRAEQGEYPETLKQLVPSVITKLPLDLYSGKSFIYQRKDDGGYLLYSVFDNEIDDLGTGMHGEIINGEYVDEQPEDFDSAESDLVVRVPVPPFQFPEPPKAEAFEMKELGGESGSPE